MVLLALLALPPCAVSASHQDVRAHGARGDGSAKDTAAVQRAIDACAAAGGGTVLFSTGTYLCGSIHLRSNVTLRLEAGATIKGSRDLADYDAPEKLGFPNAADSETALFRRALIGGEDVEGIAIVGEGTIDSNFSRRGGPKPIALKRCRRVRIEGVRILHAPNYAISMLGTDFVDIDGVTIQDSFSDGIDPDSCRNVRIANCHIETPDDSIVLKTSFSLGEHRPCDNVTVTNCFLASARHCFKIGTETGSDFRRIAVSNCVMQSLPGRGPAAAAVALLTVDGANVEGVTVSNLTIAGVRAPIFLRLGNRGRDMTTPAPGSLRNVSIANVVAVGATLACGIAGLPGSPVEDVTLSNIRVTYTGSGPMRTASEAILEQVAAYPDSTMFGALPAYGLWCRHVTGLTLSNVQLVAQPGFWRFSTQEGRSVRWDTDPPTPSQPAAPGPAVVCDDVSRLRVDGLEASASNDGSPVVQLVDVRDALIRGSVAPDGVRTFIDIRGPRSSSVTLLGNALRAAKVAATRAAGAPKRR